MSFWRTSRAQPLKPISETIASRERTQCTCGCGVLTDPCACGTRTVRASLNAPTGARCFPTGARDAANYPEKVLMHLQVRGASRPPGSGTGVMTPLPGPGAPPTPQAPRGTGQHRAQTTTFPCNHAKRHRRRPHPLQRTAFDDAMRKSRGRSQGLSPAVRVGHSRRPFPSSKMNSLPRSRLHQALAQTLVRTDLDAEMNRSRAGIRPISAKRAQTSSRSS